MRRDSKNRQILPWITDSDRRKLAEEAIPYKAACALIDDPNLVYFSVIFLFLFFN